jgi:hypothetical protein
MDLKTILDRRQALNKKGTLTDREIKSLVKEWHANSPEEELNALMVEMVMKAMEKKLEKHNVEQLGKLLIKRKDGTMRVLVNQMEGLHKHGNKRDQNCSNRTADPQVRRKCLRIYGAQFQLDKSEFIDKSSFMVSRRRKGDALCVC